MNYLAASYDTGIASHVAGTLVPQPSAEDLDVIFMGPLSAIPEFISSAVRPLFSGTSPLSSSSPGQAVAHVDRKC